MLNDLLCIGRRLIGQRRYQHVTLKIHPGRGGFIDTPSGVKAYLCDTDDDPERPTEHVIRDVWMWPWQLRRLPEFEGF